MDFNACTKIPRNPLRFLVKLYDLENSKEMDSYTSHVLVHFDHLDQIKEIPMAGTDHFDGLLRLTSCQTCGLAPEKNQIQ